MMAPLKVLIVHLLIQNSLCCLFNQPFQIFASDTSDKSNTVLGYTYKVLWATPQNGIQSHGIILRDYAILTYGFPLSYRASVSNINPSGADFNFNPSTNSRILKASFSIVVRKYCEGIIQLKITCKCTPSFLKQSPRSVDNQIASMPIGIPIVGSLDKYIYQVFISSFVLANQPVENRLAVYDSPLTSAYLNTASIPVLFISYITKNNVFSEIYITYIIIKKGTFRVPPIYFQTKSSSTSVSLTIPSDFVTNLQQKCLVGISYVDNDDSPNLILKLSGTVYSFLGGGSFFLSINAFCLSNCTATRYYAVYTPQTFSCSPCPNIANCDLCATSTTCAICLANYFLNSAKQCQACTLSHCALCFNSTFCEKCDDYYYINQNSTCSICPSISNCKMCQTATACRICNSGYWVNISANSSCTLCNQYVAGCNICTSNSTCSTCFNHYYVNTSANYICTNCSVSLTNCTLCDSISKCTKCTEWSFTDSVTTYSCQPCSTGVSNCKLCSSRTYCTACNLKYYLNSSNLCNFCYVPLPNCDICIDDTNCSSCFLGYFTDNLSNYNCVTCQSAMSECLACVSRTNCTSCRSRFFVDQMANFTCSLCSGAISNCITCSSNTTCTSCIAKYFVDATSSYTCTLCSVGISNCENCTSNITCIGCFQQFYLNSQSTCTLCSLTLRNCSICSSSTNCTTCQDGFFIDSMDNGSCNVCPPSCQSCISVYYCYSCNPTYYLRIVVTPYIRIQTCPSCLPDCLTCSNTITCITCLDDVPYRPVVGGCTKIMGCLQVDKNMSPSSKRCIKCSSLYHVIDGVCNCTTGYRMVSDLCTNVYGCIATQLINNKVVCMKCNFAFKFIQNPSNNKCICINGYQQANNTCIQKCGDGKRFQSQCDDGNLVSGDGCSPNCRIQQNFQCIGGSPVSSSRCKYLPLDIVMEIVSIKKVSLLNRAIFTFQLYPSIYFYQILNLTNTFTFQPSNIIIIEQMTMNKGKISVLTTFSDDLQDKLATIDFTLNSRYFQQLNVNLQFNISTNGTMTYLRNAQNLQLFGKVLEYLSLSVVFFFCLSLVFHQMIGVETIIPFQIIYLSHLVESNYTSVFSVFGYLANSAFNLLFYTNYSSIFKTIPANLEYSQSNRGITNYILGIIVVILGFLAMFNLFYRFMIAKEDKTIKKSKFSQALIQKLLLPIVTASFTVILPLSSEKSEFAKIFPKAQIFYLFQRIIISLTFFQHWKCLMIKKPSIIKEDTYFPNKFKENYPSLYLTFVFLATITLNTGFVSLFRNTHWYLLILCLLFTVAVAFYSPYQTKLDSAGILLNNLTMVLFLVWRVLRGAMVDLMVNQQHQLYAVMAFIGISCLGIFLNFIRLIIEIRERLSKTALRQSCAIPEQQNLKESRFEDISRMLKQDQNSFQIRNDLNYCISPSKIKHMASDYTVPLNNFMQRNQIVKYNQQISNFRKCLLEKLKGNNKQIENRMQNLNQQ